MFLYHHFKYYKLHKSLIYNIPTGTYQRDVLLENIIERNLRNLLCNVNILYYNHKNHLKCCNYVINKLIQDDYLQGIIDSGYNKCNNLLDFVNENHITYDEKLYKNNKPILINIDDKLIEINENVERIITNIAQFSVEYKKLVLLITTKDKNKAIWLSNFNEGKKFKLINEDILEEKLMILKR